MRSKKQVVHNKYEIELSPLYKLSSKKKLAALIGIDAATLANLDKSGLTSKYKIYREKKTGRFITEPIDETKTVHERLLKFITRIATPSYIHSAVKKRSYFTNAEVHISAENILKIDIKKFYPSVKFGYVYDFFKNQLKCSSDIATILAKICTVVTNNYGSHLPTGSCLSPILSFWANRPLFESIQNIALKNNCNFSLYVDDITISGTKDPQGILNEIAKLIFNYGYQYHKIKIYRKVPAKITGLIIHNGSISLPHCRAMKIRDLQKTLRISKGNLRPALLASLVGRLSEAEQINPHYKTVRKNTIALYKQEWSIVVARRARKAKLSKTP